MIVVVGILASECTLVAMMTCYKYQWKREGPRRTRRADAPEKPWYWRLRYIEVLLEPGHLSLLSGRSDLLHQSFEGYECKLCWGNREKVYITSSEEVYCETYVATNWELITELTCGTRRCIGAIHDRKLSWYGKHRNRHAQQLCYTIGIHTEKRS